MYIKREDAIKAVRGGMCTFYDCYVIEKLKEVPTVKPQVSEIIEAYTKGYEDGSKAVKQTFVADGIVFEKMDEPQTGYCNECKWFRNKQVCGRCRSKNLYAPKTETQTERSER